MAEELAQDALVAALEQWPAEGVPDNPGAWPPLIRRGLAALERAEALTGTPGPYVLQAAIAACP